MLRVTNLAPFGQRPRRRAAPLPKLNRNHSVKPKKTPDCLD